MDWIVKNLWLIPALPVLAAGLSSLAPQRCRKFSAALAIGSMVVAFLLSLCAFAHTLGNHGEAKEVFNFAWLQFAAGDAGILKLGWVLDPLTAVMLVMVTFVGTLIFIYSTGYMAHDENFTRFFTFLSLFAGAMLGVVIANSLLLLFISWELVGLTSYLLIGFWYHKPSAAAAAKKAFITTRIGDVAFLLGMVWLYSQTGTLLFFDNGTGCLEQSALGALVAKTTCCGMAVSTAIGLLIFAGAVGKSGQVPLHVWLPDAMEGPTPVSALIHAATMVAAGVFLVARVFPLMAVSGFSQNAALNDVVLSFNNHTAALQVITWVGAITAVFAASIAVAQNDIKRILAYSTVSQLGYMMMGLGVGGVAVGMFHLITHAFFKALLFMGAGSVIHGCHEEQDIRHMGGIRKFMPVTFATYAIGMLALCGFPLFFSGFWSKDEILHAAHGWRVSQIPFYLGLFGALLTAFYMTRQMALVFFGKNRATAHAHDSHGKHEAHTPHESPVAMTAPLGILAACAIALGFIGTPAWPWFQDFLEKRHAELDFGKFSEGGVVPLMLLSSVIVLGSMVLGWWLYGRKPITKASDEDVLKKARPDIYWLLENKYFIDELYEATVIRFNAWFAGVCDFLDAWVWGGAVLLISYLTIGLGWVNDSFDKFVINLGFDQGCDGVSRGGGLLSKLQDGKVQNYLRIIGGALVVLALLLIWGGWQVIRVDGLSILTVLTFVPLIGAIIVAAVGQENKRLARGLAFGTSLLSLVIAVCLWHSFNASSGALQFEERHAWMPSLAVDYRVAVDGLGLLMVLLTAIVVPMALIASWRTEDRSSIYFSLVLFLQAGLFGTFTALNFVHWFLFWELSLIPAFFLIRLWGGPQRASASTQFFVYTMVGSVALLLAFLAIYLATGSFDFTELAALAHKGQLNDALVNKLGWYGLNSRPLVAVIFGGALLGFAVKVPLMPFHTWLPTTYAEAPSGTTMLLTGVMSKMGVYGFLRILLPIFPEQMHWLQTPLLMLAVVTIVFSACAAFAQRDLKRILAYSSINHLGYCLLGIFAVQSTGGLAVVPETEKAAALNGVLLQMFNHGLTAATLFWFVSLIEQRSGGLRGLDNFGGLRKVAPVFCGLMGIALFSSLGLPGLNGFIGEFLIFKGVFPLAPWAAALSVIGILVTAIFILTILQRVFNGPLNARWAGFPDLTLAERALLVPAITLMFLLGLWPQLVLGVVNSTVVSLVAQLNH